MWVYLSACIIPSAQTLFGGIAAIRHMARTDMLVSQNRLRNWGGKKKEKEKRKRYQKIGASNSPFKGPNKANLLFIYEDTYC